jgi:hypothetical protein
MSLTGIRLVERSDRGGDYTAVTLVVTAGVRELQPTRN